MSLAPAPQGYFRLAVRPRAHAGCLSCGVRLRCRSASARPHGAACSGGIGGYHGWLPSVEDSAVECVTWELGRVRVAVRGAPSRAMTGDGAVTGESAESVSDVQMGMGAGAEKVGTLVDLGSFGGSDDDEEGEEESVARRKDSPRECARCFRPRSVCLCEHLPPLPLPCRCCVIVLQHPAERRRPLQTARIAGLVLGDEALRIVTGRRLKRDEHAALLPVAFWEALEARRVLVLFPGDGSVPISSAVEALSPHQGHASAPKLPSPSPSLVYLLVIDGTWRQAKEMWCDMRQNQWLRERLVQVRIPSIPEEAMHGEATEAQTGILRKQPAKGCMTTLEAIAHAVYHTEISHPQGGQDEGSAAALRDALLRPLRAMVRMQISYGAAAVSRTGSAKSKLARTLLSPDQ